SLSTREMALLGELLLGSGSVNGRQVAPRSYVAAASSAQIQDGAEVVAPGYGYGLWIAPATIMAQGYGGQFIIAEPKAGVVVVATSDWMGIGASAGADFNDLLTLLLDQVLPAF